MKEHPVNMYKIGTYKFCNDLFSAKYTNTTKQYKGESYLTNQSTTELHSC